MPSMRQERMALEISMDHGTAARILLLLTRPPSSGQAQRQGKGRRRPDCSFRFRGFKIVTTVVRRDGSSFQVTMAIHNNIASSPFAPQIPQRAVTVTRMICPKTKNCRGSEEISMAIVLCCWQSRRLEN